MTGEAERYTPCGQDNKQILLILNSAFAFGPFPYASLLALVLVGGGWTAGWYSAHENKRIRSCLERYGYQPFSGPVNATRYFTDLGETPARPWADELARVRRRPAGWCLGWNP